jgi:hypothetical protein
MVEKSENITVLVEKNSVDKIFVKDYSYAINRKQHRAKERKHIAYRQ